MFRAKSFYASEVLGIKNYLCPSEVHAIRHIKGDLPCAVLVVTNEELDIEKQGLLKKIMKSVQISEFTILELKDVSFLDSFMNRIEEEGLAKSVLFFGDNLLFSSFNKISFLNACSLSQLTGSSGEVQKKKKELWLELKKWKQSS